MDNAAIANIADLIDKSVKSDTSVMYVSKTYEFDKIKPYSVQVTKEKKVVFVPKNYEEVAKSNVLVRLFFNLALKENYEVVVLNNDEPIKVLKEDVVSFIKGWYAAIEKLPEYSRNINKHFKEGCMYGIDMMLDSKKIDRGLFKSTKIDNINVHLFGNAWKNSHESEKTILDHLKVFSRNQKILPTIYSWMIADAKIREKFGLKDPSKNAILTEKEHHMLQASFIDAVQFELKQIDKFSELKEFENKSAVEVLQGYTLYIKDIQKTLKPLKVLVEKEVTDRTDFVFKHPANKKLVKAKKPLREVMANVKDFAQFSNAFNSSLIMSKGQEKLTIPENHSAVGQKYMQDAVDSFCKKYKLSSAMQSELLIQFEPLTRLE